MAGSECREKLDIPGMPSFGACVEVILVVVVRPDAAFDDRRVLTPTDLSLSPAWTWFDVVDTPLVWVFFAEPHSSSASTSRSSA